MVREYSLYAKYFFVRLRCCRAALIVLKYSYGVVAAVIIHPIEPLFCESSQTLILGSFPSVKSREECFFYAHPQNRFWRVMAGICGESVPVSVEEKKSLILNNNFALWDVIHSCEIDGSSDASIKNVVPNDLSVILSRAPVKRIFANGSKAYSLYNKYLARETGIDAVLLPSTSPANARMSLDNLTQAWNEALFNR